MGLAPGAVYHTDEVCRGAPVGRGLVATPLGFVIKAPIETGMDRPFLIGEYLFD